MRRLFYILFIAASMASTAEAQVVMSKAQANDNGWYVNPIGDSAAYTMPVVAEAQETHKDFKVTTVDDAERKCVRAQNMARKDNYNKELKYYQFGMPAGDYPHGLRRQILKEKYNLEYNMMGCVPVDSLMCYNREAERILFSKYGNDFWRKVDKEVLQAAADKKSFHKKEINGRRATAPSDR